MEGQGAGGEEGDVKYGVCLLNDKIGIYLKVVWMLIGRKRRVDKVKVVMENLRQEVIKRLNEKV